jgi:hypothetical protein
VARPGGRPSGYDPHEGYVDRRPALGFFTHLAGNRATAWFGGSEPGNQVVRAADVVITMGCGDACPIFPGTPLRELGP